MYTLTHRRTDCVLELVLTGELVIPVATSLKNELVSLLEPGLDACVDLSGVERLDCAGLQLLLAGKARIESGGRSFSIVASNELVDGVLRTSGAADIFVSKGMQS